MQKVPHVFSDVIVLAKQTLALYDKQTRDHNFKVKELKDQILVLNAKLNTANRLLEVSESKRLQLLKQLDTNQYNGHL